MDDWEEKAAKKQEAYERDKSEVKQVATQIASDVVQKSPSFVGWLGEKARGVGHAVTKYAQERARSTPTSKQRQAAGSNKEITYYNKKGRVTKRVRYVGARATSGKVFFTDVPDYDPFGSSPAPRRRTSRRRQSSYDDTDSFLY